MTGKGDGAVALALARDPQGRLIAGGTWYAGDLYLRRYEPDGTPDLSFGEDGRATIFLWNEGTINDLALARDGDIVAGAGNGFSLGLARFNSDGDPDHGFGHGGRLVTPGGRRGAASLAVAVQPSGRILSAGYARANNGHWAGLLFGYRPDGSIDPSFGQGGVVKTHAPGQAAVALSGVEVLPSGKILIGGDLGGRLFLARLSANGLPDHSFGSGTGRVLVDVDGDPHCVCSYANALTVAPGGKPLLVGAADGKGRESSLIARFTPNGKLDRSFGVGGAVRTFRGSRLVASGVTTQRDGRITSVGFYNLARTGEAQVAVLRYLPNGALDRSFARGGFFSHHFGRESFANAAVTLPDGRVVVAGSARFGEPHAEFESPIEGSQFLLMRFRP